MRFFVSMLAVSAGVFVTAAPTTEVTVDSLHFPDNDFTSMPLTHDLTGPIKCIRGNNNCGVVTFSNNKYSTFGQGICMQLGKNVQSIYVAKCYCSLWHSCTGKAGDIYVGGMMMCEKPRTVGTFDKVPMYISCGGMN